MYTRFDLLPGVVVALALMYASRRPAFSGALVATGFWIKMWPLILVPIIGARRPGRRVFMVACVATTAAVSLACLLLTDGQRLLSPVLFQRNRGLHIESVAATPLMAAWAVHPEHWHVGFGKILAVEITGPGVATLASISTLASVLAGAFVLLMLWRALKFQRADTSDYLWWVSLSGIALFMATNKVLSPQYLLWFFPVVVLMAVRLPTQKAVRVVVGQHRAGVLDLPGVPHVLPVVDRTQRENRRNGGTAVCKKRGVGVAEWVLPAAGLAGDGPHVSYS